MLLLFLYEVSDNILCRKKYSKNDIKFFLINGLRIFVKYDIIY